MNSTGEKGEKVLVAMSGGVDSSVAAAVLLKAGYDVTGVFLCLGAGGDESRGCCSPQDAADARRVAETLGVRLFVLNVSDDFTPIIANFCSEYAAGRTPNPCVHCNATVKIPRLLVRADDLGARWVATGHYARIAQTPAGPAIAQGLAGGKDQSYALFAIAREHLGRLMLPIGELADKRAVREIAKGLGLNVHDKPDSQEICFAPDDDYAAVLAAHRPEALQPGDIVDSQGKVLGRHDGYARFTVGQRKGLRVAAGVPMYVTNINPATATVTIGPREQTMRRLLTARDANWHADVPSEFDATVRIRYNHAGAPARVRITASASFAVEFAEPVSAITPGQAAVAYDGQRLLGGGWIE